MNPTQIEWADRTWNPVRGCSRVSEGCRHCYAEQIAGRFSGPGRAFEGFATNGPAGARWTGRVELQPHKLAEPLSLRKPQRIFVNSTSDLFHEDLDFEAIAAVFGVMAACPLHTFLVLTKRPARALEFFASFEEASRKTGIGPAQCMAGVYAWRWLGEKYFRQLGAVFDVRWPIPNVWIGVSVEDQKTADERIPLLLQCPAAVCFISYEPALGRVDLRFPPSYAGHDRKVSTPGPASAKDQATALAARAEYIARQSTLDWVIVGGESGRGARPFDLDWARSTISQCAAVGVPCFVKQLGAFPVEDREVSTAKGGCAAPLKLRDRKGGDPSEWPEDLRVRQFPEPRA